MFGGNAARRPKTGAGDLFARIGELLHAQGLSPDPANYAFAHHLLTRTDPAAAGIVATILGDGVRLSRREIEALGGAPVVGQACDRPAYDRHRADDRRGDVHGAGERGADDRDADDRAQRRTRAQADAVAAMVRDVHDQTRDFGRDLAARAAAFGQVAGAEPILDLASTMIARAAAAEQRLAVATREADVLRAELAEAQSSARIDALTGLPNRRALDEAFAGLGPGQTHCLALCDIDHFKGINDRFGHGVGDRVLAMIARLLSDHFPGQLVARQGGEEFAVLTSGIGLDQTVRMLDQARAATGAKRLRDRDTGDPIGRVTFSGGVIELIPGEPRSDAFPRADQLLYRAKAHGRDRILT